MKQIYILTFLLITISLNAQLYPDRHTTSPSDSWKSCVEALNPNGSSDMSHWVKFDFDEIYDLAEFKIWNLNDPATLTDGVSLLRIDYSIDNINWTEAGTYEIPISAGSSFYEGIIVGSLNGVQAKHVILTAEENHGGTCYGFSEIRFYLGLVVPIELLSFEADCSDDRMKVKWSFGEVSDFQSAELEWSIDGSEWETIYTTQETGKENNGVLSNEYIDIRNRINEKNFYRLKINDNNGQIEYSNVVNSSCDLSIQDITIYPQPVSDQMTINMDLMESSEINSTTYNILGQEIERKVLQGAEGMNQFIFNVNEYVTGQYVIRFEINGNYIEKKFIKK
jgi:hypothetical protein